MLLHNKDNSLMNTSYTLVSWSYLFFDYLFVLETHQGVPSFHDDLACSTMIGMRYDYICLTGKSN